MAGCGQMVQWTCRSHTEVISATGCRVKMALQIGYAGVFKPQSSSWLLPPWDLKRAASEQVECVCELADLPLLARGNRW